MTEQTTTTKDAGRDVMDRVRDPELLNPDRIVAVLHRVSEGETTVRDASFLQELLISLLALDSCWGHKPGGQRVALCASAMMTLGRLGSEWVDDGLIAPTPA